LEHPFFREYGKENVNMNCNLWLLCEWLRILGDWYVTFLINQIIPLILCLNLISYIQI
jgi:hypothetical protein